MEMEEYQTVYAMHHGETSNTVYAIIIIIIITDNY